MSCNKGNIIIIGATSGLGLALAQCYAQDDYKVGITGRGLEKLRDFQKEYLGKAYITQLDVTDAKRAESQLQHLISQMEGVDTIIISVAVGFMDKDIDFAKEKRTFDVNVSGFSLIAGRAFNYFIEQGKGQLASISSVNASRASDFAPAYSIAKSRISHYMQGLSKEARKLKLPITISDIQAGPVTAEIAKENGTNLNTLVDNIAEQVKNAIEKKKKHVQIGKSSFSVAWLLKILPDWLIHKT